MRVHARLGLRGGGESREYQVSRPGDTVRRTTRLSVRRPIRRIGCAARVGAERSIPLVPPPVRYRPVQDTFHGITHGPGSCRIALRLRTQRISDARRVDDAWRRHPRHRDCDHVRRRVERRHRRCVRRLWVALARGHHEEPGYSSDQHHSHHPALLHPCRASDVPLTSLQCASMLSAPKGIRARYAGLGDPRVTRQFSFSTVLRWIASPRRAGPSAASAPTPSMKSDTPLHIPSLARSTAPHNRHIATGSRLDRRRRMDLRQSGAAFTL